MSSDSFDREMLTAARRTLGGGATRREAIRRLAGAGLGAAVAGRLVTAATPAVAEEPKRGGHLRVAYSATVGNPDPAHATDDITYSRLFMFYNGLTIFDPHLNPLPELAESIENQKATVWTIKLRKGVTFHDGSPFTSADVVYSLARHKDPKVGSVVLPFAEQMVGIKATGPHEVQITLKSPNSGFPAVLAIYQFVIVKDGTTDFSKGIGTGPFRSKVFSPGGRSIAVRNPHYFKHGLPYLDQVTFFGIADEAARIDALLSGDIEIAAAITPLVTRQVKAAKGYQVFETKAGNYTDLIVRLDVPHTGNLDFAMAMKYLQDRDQIRNHVFQNYAVIGNDQPIDPTNPVYCSHIPQRSFDQDKAKFHLSKSGLMNSTIPIVCSPAANGSAEMAVMMQDAARKIGLNLDIRRVPADGYWSNYWMKSPVCYGNILPRPSADILFTLFFKSNAPWNESGWKDPKFDQLLLAARAETDAARRKQLYCDMQRLVRDHAGIGIPVFISLLDAHSSRVKGLRPVPTGDLMGYYFAQHVWLET